MRVLLVEDSKRLQRSISRGLRKEGFKVDVTGEGNEGLWYVESFDYDVIVLDLMLPQMDGCELTQRLASIQPKMKVLFMSGYSDHDLVHHEVINKGRAFLPKPFTMETLLEKLQEVLDTPVPEAA